MIGEGKLVSPPPRGPQTESGLCLGVVRARESNPMAIDRAKMACGQLKFPRLRHFGLPLCEGFWSRDVLRDAEWIGLSASRHRVRSCRRAEFRTRSNAS